MDNSFKIIIFGKKIYREVELPKDNTSIKIGTTKDCDIRFKKDIFFNEFEINIVFTEDKWQMICGDGIFFTTDGVLKLFAKDLVHGDKFIIKYLDSNIEIFKLNFMIDFDTNDRNYERKISIKNKDKILIGGTENCDILLKDSLLGKDTVLLTSQQGKYVLTDNNTRYGVNINGKRIEGKEEIKDYDFFTIVGFSFYLKEGYLYTDKSDLITVKTLEYVDLKEQNNAYEYPKFNRNTRIQYVIPEEKLEVLPPVTKPNKPKRNILVTLAPVLAMIALTVVLRGIMGGGGTFVIYSVCTMSVGAIMSVVTHIMDKKEYKKEVEKRRVKYLEYIDEKDKELEEERKNEVRILNLIHSPIDENIEEARSFGRRLFEKDFEDEDFLYIRVGTGRILAKNIVEITKQEFKDTEDDLLLLPEKLEQKYRYIDNAPIVCKFSESNGVGVVGESRELYSMLKTMTIDLVTRHFYKDVKIYYMFSQEDKNRFKWTRWLGHVANDRIDIRNLMYDEESKNVILELIYSELSRREALAASDEENKDFDIQYVVFIFDMKGIFKHPISKYISCGNKYGFTFVFFVEHEELLPKGCTEIIRLSSGNEGDILLSKNGDDLAHFVYKDIPDKVVSEIALKLSPTYVDEVSLESELTKNITLFELLKIMSIEDLDIKSRWETSQVYKSMAVPLGVKTKGEIVYLDISDKANGHGPHGLVAGTTGSGKSEIIQSYVLSMATLFHPYDIGIMIIDFKGGGMANQFTDLPHLLGTITNIDGREINRSLLSIKAELVRRQEIFAESGVNHINDYIKLYKEGKVNKPLPHLIMIVDEFAELKAEYPDFMKEIISAARIGRTLGVHLILATQKPSGVVDNQIWSNSKFKLCLKVQTKEDSNEVIKTPLAAEIVEPGRAYFQVGNNEIFELFQSAYSGAKVNENETEENKVDIYKLNLWGKKELVYTNKQKSDNKNAKTQLQVIVDYIKDYCEKNGISKLPGICLPPLKDVIYIDEINKPRKNMVDGVSVAIGIYDDPELQKQEELVVNLSESNTFIIGSAQMGKTTLLQSIIYEIMDIFTPKEVNIYVIDCGNMAMKVFENANHVGGVVLLSEEERIINLFKLLKKTIEKRKAIFAEKGIGTFKSYIEAGFSDLPQIFLIIDNVASFREYYESATEDILLLSREGQSVGINIIATATQTNALSYKTIANFGNRIAFICNDKGEYSNLFDRCRIDPKDTVGRGLAVVDKRLLEFQSVLCVKGDKEIKRVENIKAFIEKNSNEYGNMKAVPIPIVPEVIKSNELYKENRELYSVSYRIPIGIDYDNVDYNFIELDKIGMLTVMGRERSGKTNFIRNIMSSINKNIFNNITEAFVFDNSERSLESVSKFGFVNKYTTDDTEFDEVVEYFVSELEARYEVFIEKKGEESVSTILEEYPLLLMVIDNPAIIDKFTKDKELYAKFLQIIKKYKHLKVAIIFGSIENMQVGFSTADIIKQIKESKKVVVFDDISNIKFFDINIRQQKDHGKPIKLGDAFTFFDGNIIRIKTILDTF